jgi:putative pyridoxal-dependent aspartate 1-decarboxylase
MEEKRTQVHGRKRPRKRPHVQPVDSTESVKERVLELFAVSGQIAWAERAATTQLSGMIRDFLQAPLISAQGEMDILKERFKESRISAKPSDVSSYLRYLAEVLQHCVNVSSPRFIGHMTSALPYFAMPLAALMTAMNQNVVKVETSKALTLFERQAIATLHRLVYNFENSFYSKHIQERDSTLGIMTTGGTLANMTALWCARNACLGPRDGFAGVEEEGLPAALKYYGYDGAVMIGSNLMHYSVEKAAGLMGIGSAGLIKLRGDANYQVQPAALRRAIDECRGRNQRVMAIIGNAGTTDCGSIDPLAAMSEISHDNGIHFHVDAAWGGPLLFSDKHKGKLEGIEQADSVTIDGHKQLYLPIGIGVVLMRDPETARAIQKQARYIIRAQSSDLGRHAIEGSRPGTALFLHAALSILGREGYEFLIDEGIRKAQYLADLIRSRPQFELLTVPKMNIITYRFVPECWRTEESRSRMSKSDELRVNYFNEEIQKFQLETGRSFVSRTTLENKQPGRDTPVVALRAVLANPLTTEADIEAALDEQLKISRRLF